MACLLSFDQVDELEAAAHRIRLHAHLIVDVLEGRWKADEDRFINEGLSDLATMTIAHAEAMIALITSGCETARQDTAPAALSDFRQRRTDTPALT